MGLDGVYAVIVMGAFMLILGLLGSLCAMLRVPARWRIWYKRFRAVKVDRKERRWH